jgi:hypothetical protein
MENMTTQQTIDMVLKLLSDQQREYTLQQKNPFVPDTMRMQYSQMEYAIRTAKFGIMEKMGMIGL